ncbi:MAG: CBS domain-containing protein [Nanoarchaeota archaeon]
MKIAGVKLGDFVTAKEGESVMLLARKMKKKGLRHVYIVDSKGLPRGVVSLVDFNNKIVAEGKCSGDFKARDIMNSPVWCVDAEEDIGKAYSEMIKLGRYILPVTKKGKLLGILSMGEALKAVVMEKNAKKNKN